ncbi:MAG TPA: twin-arginine translocation signal domain-containing protein, partial [Methylomirabilota bacterium]|nr:twin-arginine translocation signal domain-containing protein [Methylomirabilota bacterium]
MSNSPMISRRTFLRTTSMMAGAAVLAPVGRLFGADKLDGKIMTVLGPIAPDKLGITLTHEHGVVDFLGAEKSKTLRHDREEAFQTILPYLKRLKENGGQSFVECTP